MATNVQKSTSGSPSFGAVELYIDSWKLVTTNDMAITAIMRRNIIHPGDSETETLSPSFSQNVFG